MVAITIPTQHRPGFAALLSFDPPTMAAFQSALSTHSIRPSGADLAEEIAPEIPSATTAQLEEAIDALTSLQLYRSTTDQLARDIAEGICETIDASSELQFGKKSRNEFKQQLTDLLEIPALTLQAKAQDLLLEYERLFFGARILTDIRPVFPSESVEHPGGFVLTHNLKITYGEAAQQKDFFVSLSGDDLRTLLDVAERAQAKAEALRTFLSRYDVPSIDVG